MRSARLLAAVGVISGALACGGGGTGGQVTGGGGAGGTSAGETGGARTSSTGGAGGHQGGDGGVGGGGGGAGGNSSSGPSSSSAVGSGGAGAGGTSSSQSASSSQSSASSSQSSASSSAASTGSGTSCGGSCDTPPSPCYAAAGTCEGGQCVYGFADGASCDDGDPCTRNDRCAAGVCSGTAFLCDTPPAPSCIDAHTLRTASAPTGTCSGGCIYPHTDVTCSGGTCAAGACSSGAGGVVTVSAGARHTCALLGGGGIECWGDNTWGQLGDGTNTQRIVPVAVQGLAGPAIALAAGETATCALISGGAVQCWGSGALGALGDGGTTDRSSPVTVQGLGGAATAIAVGSSEGCALVGGGVQCWGDNGEGKLGAGSTDGFSLVPLSVQGLPPGVAALSLGYGHGCAIGNGNVPQCWGFDLDDELGNPGVVDFSAVAVPATAFTASAIGVGANAQFTCIVTSAGAVQCIGDDGEAGFGPVTPAGLASGVLAVSAGSYFRCAILTGGKLACWGDDGFGQIGDGVTPAGGTVSAPTVVQGLASGVVQVSTGQAHTCAITSAGHVKCWGFNAYGQLGNNSTNDTNAPVNVIGF